MEKAHLNLTTIFKCAKYLTSKYRNTLKITAFKLFFIRRNVMVEWLEIYCFPTPQHLFEESLKFLMHIPTGLKNSVFFPPFLLLPLSIVFI